MRKNLFKKITAAVLALTMIVGSTGIVSARATNGADVAANGVWSSFSVCTREDGGEWEDALIGLRTDAFPNGQVKGQDYATEGWIVPGSTAKEAQFYLHNTGWDGNYDPNGNLVADNPWGLWASFTGVPVELGRYYTISFQIKSTVKGTVTVKDENGDPVKDENGDEVKKDVTTKHVSFKAYDPVSTGEPGVEFVDITMSGGGEVSLGGMMTLDSANEEWQTVTAVIKIPETKRLYAANVVGFKMAAGAMMVTYPDEIAMTGSIFIKNFTVTAGTQHKVTLTNGSKTFTRYVNDGEKAAYEAIGKKGYTLKGYKTSSGSMYNFNTPVTKDTKLTAVYTKTKGPAKPAVKTLKSTGRKKVKVTLKKKVANAKGYQVKYSYKKNMKGAKTKAFSKTTYTLKGLKSRKMVYVQVRAYTYDSSGNKVYGKYSTKKRAYVK